MSKGITSIKSVVKNDRLVKLLKPNQQKESSRFNNLPVVKLKLNSSNADESRPRRDDATMLNEELMPVPK